MSSPGIDDESSLGLERLTIDELSDARRASIRDALTSYKLTVLHQNLSILQILISAAESETISEQHTTEEIQEARQELFECYQVGLASREVCSPRELLDPEVRHDLIAGSELDGVDDSPVDLETVRQWSTMIWRRIVELRPGPLPDSLPPDLMYLMTLASGIIGPGLPYWRMMQQTTFYSAQETREIHDLVCVPSLSDGLDITSFHERLWNVSRKWEVAVGISTGTGQKTAESWVLFCRSHCADRREWKWRYCKQEANWMSELYDAVEELLGWYAHSREQTKETLEIVPVQQYLWSADDMTDDV